MENELDLLLRTAIDSLPKLEILIHFIRDSGAVRTAAEIGVHLRRPADEVTKALEELSQAGLIDRFALGTGKHVLYGPRDDNHVRELLQLLYTRYQTPTGRVQLLREAMGQGGRSELQSEPAAP